MSDSEYDDLDRHFTLPKGQLSPFYNFKRLPRKLKKKIGLKTITDLNIRLWVYLGNTNLRYRTFIIKQIVKSDKNG